MDNLARPEMDGESAGGFGASLVHGVLSDGSAGAIAPLCDFLSQTDLAVSTRREMKGVRPALVADIAHFMNVSHGRHPGVIDHAATKIVDEQARDWLLRAVEGIMIERRYLNALTVAAGPYHVHPGQDRVNAVLAQQAKNFELLATSDRRGTAAGAAIAFAVDWMQTRALLDSAAILLGLEPPPSALPSNEQSAIFAQALAPDAASERAITFGAQQLLAQQKGLWQLIAARHVEMLAG